MYIYDVSVYICVFICIIYFYIYMEQFEVLCG